MIKVDIPAAGWSPRPHQMGVWADMEAEIRNILLVAHRRWGKDEIGLNDCAIRAAKTPANYFYCLPEQEHARRSMWSAINKHTGKRRMDECFPEGFRIGHLKEQEMAIDVHSSAPAKSKVYVSAPTPQHYRSRVQFLGSDNYNTIVGGSPYGVYLSEWAIADPQALAMLRPIIEENGGFMRFLTTPRGKNHVYRQLNAQVGKAGWAVHFQSALETNVFSAEKLEALRLEALSLYGPDIGHALFQQEYLCTFETVVPGAYYSDMIARLEKQGRMCGILPMEEYPVYAAFDIGWDDAMAIWYFQVMRDNSVNVLDYEEVRKTSIPQVIKILRERTWSYGAVLLPHDGKHHEVTSGETTETLLTKAGFLCYIAPRTDEITQISSVRMCLPRCQFNQMNCERGITCLKNYHNKYKTDTEVWSPRAVHDWSSHGAKAFAVLAYYAASLRDGVFGAKHAGLKADNHLPISSGAQAWMT